MTDTGPLAPQALISVIVPIYNVVDHVAACIESLRTQTYSRIEVLMIDDGSTDGSGTVAEQAAAGDPRFRRITQANAGLSAARNTGLEAATGDLIAFVDSDDRVAPEFLDVLATALEAHDADWVACAIRNHGPDGGQSVHSAIHDAADTSLYPGPTRFGFATGLDVIRHYPSAWNKLYRRALIGETRFVPGTWFEDHDFYYALAARTDHLLHIPHALYHQTRGRAGQITEADDPRVFDQFTVLEDLLPRIRAWPEGAAAADVLTSRLIHERSTALRDPDRRRAFAETARLFFADHGLTYRADKVSGASVAWGREMDGETLLSVVMPWRGPDTGPLAATCARIRQSHGPRFDLIIICDNATDADAARACVPTGARVLQQAGRGTGAARIMGLEAAIGRYVTFLNAGDLPGPWTWHDWIEAMLAARAKIGLADFETGPDARPSSGFDADQTPPHGLFVPTVEQILSTDLALSAKIFDRTFLDRERLGPTPTRHSGWALVLGALLIGDRVLRLPRGTVHINPACTPEPAVNLWRLSRDLDLICASLPALAAHTLPRGWQRRFFARALRLWLLQGRPRSRPGQVLAMAAAMLAIATRGYNHAGQAWNAGFDSNVDPGFAQLFDPIAVIRLLRARERARLAAGGILPEDSIAPPIAPRSDPLGYPTYSFAFAHEAHLRLRVDFRHANTAQISFYGGDGKTVPLHLSLRKDSGEIVVNDTRSDGIWRAERPHDVPLPRTGAELTLTLESARVNLWVGARPVFNVAGRTLWNRGGVSGLTAITHIQTQGDITLLDARADAGDPGNSLALDGRLQLRATGGGDDATLHVSTLDEPLPMQAMPLGPGRPGLRAPLPARAWAPLPLEGALTFHLSTTERTLTLTRADMAHRIRDILARPVPLGDSDLIMTMIEHVRLGQLGPLMPPGARDALMRLASAYGLANYLAPAFEGQTLTLATADPPDPAMDVVADIVAAMRQKPPADPIALLPTLTLPRGEEAKVLQSLIEAVWQDDDAMHGLMKEAWRRKLGPMPLLGENSWARSAILPFLLMEGRVTELKAALWELAQPDKAWLVTPALAWVGHQVIARHPALDETSAELVTFGLIKALRVRAPDYWDRTRCRALTGWAAALLRNQMRWHIDMRRIITAFCLEVYGMSPGFWEDLGTDITGLPMQIAQARAAFDRLTARDADRATRADALDVLQALGVGGVLQARTDYLGPVGVLLPDEAPLTPDRLTPLPQAVRPHALLRHMAFPGTPEHPVDPGLQAELRDTIATLQTDQEPSPYTALQSRLSAQLTDWVTDPTPLLEDPQKQALLLGDLAVLSTERSRYLGLGLALILMSTLRADSHAPLRARLTEWLLAQDSPDPHDARQEVGYWRRQAPPVMSGLTALHASGLPEADVILARYTALPPQTTDREACNRTLPPLPVLPDAHDPGLPAPHPLNDVLVTVFSCQPYLDTRIPALRDGWLKQLEALGIPYVIVVGGGDNTLRGDVLWLDAPDDYEGLPQKTLATLDWVHTNTTFGALYKVDDDCFVNAPLLFGELNWRKADYMGRRIHREPGQTDRSWHQEKSTSDRGRLEIDKSPEPSLYADGGSGYVLSRRAMQEALAATSSPEGQALLATSFMEDKLLGDLLLLRGIYMTPIRYHAAVRRRSFGDAVPVPYWNSNFFPSRSAPIHQVHMDTHLGQQALNDRLDSDQLHPKKIWPSFQTPRVGYQSNTLDLLSPEDRVARAAAVDVAVVAVMRNERFMLPHFLAHYRRLGVGAFLIADNVSDDGTREMLLEQEDVALFSVDTDYKQSHYGVAWQQAMLSACRQGRWSVVADADELLVWQEKQTQTLPDLLKSEPFRDVDAAQVFMLDMYPQGPLSEADFRDASPFEQAGFADAIPFLENPINRGPYSDQTLWTSALRHRLLPGSAHDMFAAQKTALLRYAPWMQLADGLHFVSPPRLSPQQLIFGHFKYNADFRRKAVEEVTRNQHFNDAAEYRKYLALTAEGRAVLYDKDLSRPWAQVPFVRDRLIP